MLKKVEPDGACQEMAAAVEALTRLYESSVRLAGRGSRGELAAPDLTDHLGLGPAVMQLGASLAANPARLASAQVNLWLQYQQLAQGAWLRALGLASPRVAEPDDDDRRFKDPAWDQVPLFDLIKQMYLLNGRAVLDVISGAEGLDESARTKLDFATRQLIDALAPTNFAATNPAVLRETAESGGRNLVEGLANLVSDVERSGWKLDVSTTDLSAFELGENLAVTPGKVIHQTDLMQLIQYEPTTQKVHRRPLLVMPPWMNKYYIMDLRPGNSFVQWLVDQGHTVFMVSWVNPDASFADKGLEDYMVEGPLAALDAIEAATGEREVNAVGYCLGGILLSATVGWMAATGDDRIRSATYLTTMVDFSDVGEVGMFIEPEGLDALEAKIREQGYLDGRAVAATWRSVRANDLVWSFFVHNYLLGRKPAPFDLLYWNADSTNLPAEVHTFVMRRFYLENRLAKPGGIELCGTPVDMTRVKTPAYILSAGEDHIAPWRTTYATTQLFQGPRRFVLGASGHIAGVINPPHKGKYGYWTNRKLPADPQDWADGATAHDGSWWPDWQRWVKRYAGGQVPARRPGDGGLVPVEDAPGSYVRVRLEDL